MMAAVLVAGAALAGAVAGWTVVPWAADRALKRVRSRADSWWDDSLEVYRTFKRDHPGAEPTSASPGEEGAVGLWREYALEQAHLGVLTREHLCALAQAGLNMSGMVAAGTEEERALRCSFRPRMWQRAACAVGAATFAAFAAVLAPSVGAAVALLVCLLAMEVAVVCDLRARTIPLETCVLVVLAGAAFQVAVNGFEGVMAGLMFAGIAVIGSMVANRVLRGHCPGGAVGGGDVRCMGALSVATGAGAACGFAACYALAAATSLAGCATKRLTWTDGVPMAPFLTVWLACGASVSLIVT